MNHLRNSFYLVLIITSLSCSAEKKSQYQLVSPSKYSIDESTIANMDHAMQGFVDRKELAGIVALAAKNGELFYFKCFGMQDIENNRKMALNSSFQIQSMTKPITMTALMILIEEGKIKLDDPVEKYLPAYSNMSIIQGDGSLKPAQTVMTIKHCVMHLSGLANPAHPAVRSIVKFNETKSL
ncbi:MAG: beta-lactamase family protein, partial [Calditrichaeota bacterium]|nr:beta-lactamase family protein [Calditrichota bacterium]